MSLQIIKQSFTKFALVLSIVGLSLNTVSAYAAENIVTIASNTADLSTLVTAVKAAGLVDTLNGSGPFTVLAPTNAAFDKLPAGLLDKLVMPENKTALTKILTYHVISGNNMAADVIKLDGQSVPTVNGASIKIKVANGAVMLDDKVNVTKTDIVASNGVVHLIDQVLVPADLDLTTLVSKPATSGNTTTHNTVRSGGLGLTTAISSIVPLIVLGLVFSLTFKNQN